MAGPVTVGVDVGGTFTDVVVDDGGRLTVAKVPSTRDDQAEGVLAGVRRAGADPGTLDRFVHGTTVATNAVLERAGARLALVVTAGVRDLLEIGRQDRPHLYDLFADRPPPLVRRGDVVEAPERIGADGQIVVPLGDVGAVADAVAARAPEAVAVCLLFSFRDDRHERAVADALAGLGVPVSRSSEVLPVFREYERASTTALNAYVAPRLGRYLASLGRRLTEAGLRPEVEVMRSSGGTFTAEMAARYPVHTLLSGPAAGAWGAAAVTAASDHPDAISFDMGGTSTDVTLITGGRPATTAEGAIDGLPFAVTTTDVVTVGAGGGSIAWRDAGGALRVGPRSAGADPGPAAYGRGGDEPTVTDAHVVLGRLDPDARLGGDLQLDADAAHAAVGRLARRLELDVTATAEGIVRVAEATIARALRVVSVERGRDPRRHALVAFGGAGPLHQAALARELASSAVLVPPHAGVLAAIGLLAAPVTADTVRTRPTDLASARRADLEQGWHELDEEVRGLLAAQGVEVARVRRSADCRYPGQAYELEVAVDSADPAELTDRFHDAHADRYGYAQRDERVELVNLRTRAEGPDPRLPLPEVAEGRGADTAVVGERRVVVDGGSATVAVYARDRLGGGDRFAGPAIVAGLDTTVWVAPWQTAEVDRLGGLLLCAR